MVLVLNEMVLVLVIGDVARTSTAYGKQWLALNGCLMAAVGIATDEQWLAPHLRTMAGT